MRLFGGSPLIEDLNKCNYGITINDFDFNFMCYADDILLCSVTNYGLQCLIDRAVEYIRNHVLRFNPDMLFGKYSFTAIPRWTMNYISECCAIYKVPGN